MRWRRGYPLCGRHGNVDSAADLPPCGGLSLLRVRTSPHTKRSRDRFLISLALPSVSWTNKARAVGSYSGMYLWHASIKTTRRTLAAYCWYGLPLQWREEGGRRDLNERIAEERSVLGHLGLSRRLFILQIASLSRSSTARSIADSRGMGMYPPRPATSHETLCLEAFLQASGHGTHATHPYEA